MAAKTGGGAAKTVATKAAAPKSKPADIAAATEFEASGAPAQVVPDVDPAHLSVDNDPRAGTTVEQNQIDFNEPSALTPAEEAVAKNLRDQA